MTVVSVGIPQPSVDTASGMRPVNLRTDLAPLADLIELVFEDTMDSSGRAALREMRMLSRVGAGLNLLSRLNELALGINMGYVWIEDGKLVGNVSVYPANWHPDLGSAWIIANVGVHPDYQRRGIARRLMQACLDMIRARHGQTAILQVDYNNDIARSLYLSLGFVEERAWVQWRRPAAARLPLPVEGNLPYITHRRRNEWRAEYALAQQVRPVSMGGIGWLRPLHRNLFRSSFFKWFDNLFNLRSTERLIVRSENDTEILATL
ncbi:MAG TPA: GNAT family N-acetyltransferase, partial [Phototrophicaceae bacterium]|nr:GNAT family N-acetyltransferase [Phototrophicaceae bacterium]